jgi:outer membrane receptor protein involved in Fe transport
MRSKSIKAVALCSTALVIAGSCASSALADGDVSAPSSRAKATAAPAFSLAQAGARRAPAPAAAADDSIGQLEEVVVTATRQLDTVNRVPLSVSAETQRSLDQRGIRNIADLSGAVPALNVNQSAPGVAFVAIRGIQNNGQGTATSGIYLDDTALTKRGALGCGSCTGNGSPIPPLFDLERVEVLRGPQGTLYGSGSEGGTIRYITPEPSLTRYSVYARGEVSSTWNGDPSYEAGVAAGGPIVQDKLGFRVSVFARHTGGWLDYVNRVTGEQWAENANDGDARAFKAALTWAPFDRARITASLYSARDAWDSQAQGYHLSTSAPINEPEACFSAAGAQLPSCSSPGVAYRRGPLTLPQLTGLGTHTSLDPFLSPAKTNFTVASVTAEYDFGVAMLKSITSYVHDQSRLVNNDGGALIRTRATNADYGGIRVRNLNAYAGLPTLPQEFLYGKFFDMNRRTGLTEEVRLSSTADARPVSWVAGVYFTDQRATQQYDNTYPSIDVLEQSLFGVTSVQKFGFPPYVFNGVAVGAAGAYQTLKDVESAAFGEINYWVLPRLKLIGGIRVSHLDFQYLESQKGPLNGGNDPLKAPGGVTGPLSVTNTPIAPKYGFQYEISDRDLVYFTAAKGFRAGGVNRVPAAGVCNPGLARFGFTADNLPRTYDADTVWSYEVGGKFRVLDNRVQLNGSLYRIDWTNIQTNVTIPAPCGVPFTTNAGSARSQGFELEVNALILRGLTANASLAYDEAKYTETVLALNKSGFDTLSASLKGQRLTIPPLTANIGARYDLDLSPTTKMYLRADWFYARHYSDTGAQIFGASSYAPNAIFPNTQRVNLRVGLEYAGLDINVFANNVFNSRKGIVTGGYGSCPSAASGGNPACTTGQYQPYFSGSAAAYPRQVGLQVAYRR